MNKKIGVWIVLIFTSLALVIPSLAIVYNLLFSDVATQSVVISPDDISVSVQTSDPVENLEGGVSTGEANIESLGVSVSTQEAQ